MPRSPSRLPPRNSPMPKKATASFSSSTDDGGGATAAAGGGASTTAMTGAAAAASPSSSSSMSSNSEATADDTAQFHGGSFIAFVSHLCDVDQIFKAPSRPLTSMVHVPSLPIRSNYLFRMQVNLLWYLRNYVTILLVSLALLCCIYPLLLAPIALAVLLHREYHQRGSPSISNSNSNSNGTLDSNSREQEQKQQRQQENQQQKQPQQLQEFSTAAKWRIRLISTLQAICIVYLLFFHYNPLRLCGLAVLPIVGTLMHATFTPYTDAASRQLEAFVQSNKRITAAVRKELSPVRHPTPVRRWEPGDASTATPRRQ